VIKKLLYLTVTAPLGQREAFLIPEMNCLARRGVELTIIPVNPAGRVFHRDGAGLLSRTIAAGLWGGEVLLSVLAWLIRAPLRVALLLLLLLKSGAPANRVKNLLVFPKGLFIAGKVRALGIDHIHAHWASTPSTCALVASAMTGVAWSFTAHRWDIANNNLIREKVDRCSFVRVISSRGREQITGIAGVDVKEKVFYCPMGVDAPGEAPARRRAGGRRPVIAAVGSLTPVKGHCHLLRACRLLADWGGNFRCLVIGDGPERKYLEVQALRLELGELVTFTGALPHDRVLRILGSGAFFVLVHPSVETPDGQHEGVPVAVMEAMVRGVPVVVTATGGVTELVDGETGLIVPPGDSMALARAVGRLLDDPAGARRLAEAARRRIDRDFSLERNVAALMDRMNMAP